VPQSGKAGASGGYDCGWLLQQEFVAKHTLPALLNTQESETKINIKNV
jgi:hypothetical protein